MQPIPGSAIEFAGCHAGPEHLEIVFDATPRGARYYEKPRWPPGVKPPMTKKRAAAIAKKRRGIVVLEDGTCIGGGVDGYASKNHAKPKNWLLECASGKELIAAFASGEAFLFPLENRRGKEYVPTCIPIAAKWKMRTPHVRIVQVIATAMIGWKKRGLVITYPELVKLATSSGRRIIELCERSIGTYVRQLREWGLVSTTPTFLPKGCVTDERASVYHLTTLAALVWRLNVPSECGALPDPETEISIPNEAKSIDHPERQSLPANPETPLRGRSPEEHEAYPPDYRGVGEAADTAPRADSVRCLQGTDSRAVAATFSGELFSPPTSDVGESITTPAQPEMLPETRHAVGRRSAPGFVPPLPEAEAKEQSAPLLLPSSDENATELELASRRIGEIRRDDPRSQTDRDIAERYVEGDPRETERRLRLARGRAIAEDAADLKRRQAAQLELVRKREAENERQRERRGSRGVEFEDDELAPTNGVIDPATAELLRKHRESLADEQRERRYNMQGPTTRPSKKDPDAELADAMESAWRSGFGAPTIKAQLELEKLRGGKS